jgi:hypothetical protein
MRELTMGWVLHTFSDEACSGPMHMLRFSPDGKVLYAINLQGDRAAENKSLVRRFDTATGKLTA